MARSFTYMGLPFELDHIPEDATDEQVKSYMDSQMQTPEGRKFYTDRAKELGYDRYDVMALNGDERAAERRAAETAGPLRKLWEGVKRAGQSLENTLGDLSTNSFIANLSANAMQNAGATMMMSEEKKGEATAGMRERLANTNAQILQRERQQREAYSVFDDAPGLMGTTIGMEDLGELLPTIATFVAGAPAAGTSLLRNAALASIAGGLQGRTDDESRLEAMLWSGALGVAVPGVGMVGSRALSGLFAGGGRYAASAMGALAGIKGLGRVTNWVASLGGAARKGNRNTALIEDAANLQREVYQNLEPIIQNLGRRESQILANQQMREKMKDLFVRNAIPEAGPGLNVSAWLREINAIGDTTLRNRLGSTYGNQLIEVKAAANAIAPRLAAISADPTMQQIARHGVFKGFLPATFDFVFGGTFEALRRAAKPPQWQKVLEGHMFRALNAGIAMIPEEVEQAAAHMAMRKLFDPAVVREFDEEQEEINAAMEQQIAAGTQPAAPPSASGM